MNQNQKKTFNGTSKLLFFDHTTEKEIKEKKPKKEKYRSINSKSDILNEYESDNIKYQNSINNMNRNSFNNSFSNEKSQRREIYQETSKNLNNFDMNIYKLSHSNNKSKKKTSMTLKSVNVNMNNNLNNSNLISLLDDIKKIQRNHSVNNPNDPLYNNENNYFPYEIEEDFEEYIMNNFSNFSINDIYLNDIHNINKNILTRDDKILIGLDNLKHNITSSKITFPYLNTTNKGDFKINNNSTIKNSNNKKEKEKVKEEELKYDNNTNNYFYEINNNYNNQKLKKESVYLKSPNYSNNRVTNRYHIHNNNLIKNNVNNGSIDDDVSKNLKITYLSFRNNNFNNSNSFSNNKFNNNTKSNNSKSTSFFISSYSKNMQYEKNSNAGSTIFLKHKGFKKIETTKNLNSPHFLEADGQQTNYANEDLIIQNNNISINLNCNFSSKKFYQLPNLVINNNSKRKNNEDIINGDRNQFIDFNSNTNEDINMTFDSKVAPITNNNIFSDELFLNRTKEIFDVHRLLSENTLIDFNTKKECFSDKGNTPKLKTILKLPVINVTNKFK